MSCNSEGEVHLLDEYFEKSDDGTVFYSSIHISLLVYRGWQFCKTWFYLFLSAHRPQVIINLNTNHKLGRSLIFFKVLSDPIRGCIFSQELKIHTQMVSSHILLIVNCLSFGYSASARDNPYFLSRKDKKPQKATQRRSSSLHYCLSLHHIVV